MAELGLESYIANEAGCSSEAGSTLNIALAITVTVAPFSAQYVFYVSSEIRVYIRFAGCNRGPSVVPVCAHHLHRHYTGHCTI